MSLMEFLVPREEKMSMSRKIRQAAEAAARLRVDRSSAARRREHARRYSTPAAATAAAAARARGAWAGKRWVWEKGVCKKRGTAGKLIPARAGKRRRRHTIQAPNYAARAKIPRGIQRRSAAVHEGGARTATPS